MSGTLYWITGLSGSGKTTISKLVYKKLKNEKKNIVFLDGDNIRKALKLTRSSYDLQSRKKLAYTYAELAKLLIEQEIDVIFATIAMFHEIRDWNRSKIKNYIEVYIKVPLDILVERDKKNLYSKFLKKKIKNVVGIDIKLEEPKKPDIIIINDGSKSPTKLANILLEKITTINKNPNV